MSKPNSNIDARYYSDDGGSYYSDRQSKNTTPGQNTDINIYEWLARFARHWPLFVVAVAIALIIGYLENRSWQPLYTTEGKIIIESNANNGSYNFMQGFSAGYDIENANNQLLILGSYDLINRTIQKLPFGIDFYTRGRFRTNSMYGREPIVIDLKHLAPEAYGCEFRFRPINDTKFEILLEDEFSRELYPEFKISGQYGVPFENFLFFGTIEKLYLPASNTEFLFQFRSIESLEEEFAKRLQLEYIGEKSTVVSIVLASSIPQRDKDFIDALSREFLAQNLEEKNQEATRTIDFINSQLSYIADSLRSSEIRLQQYRRQHNLVDINGYTSTILGKLASLDMQQSELTLKEAYFNELSKYLEENIVDDKLVAPSSIGVSDPVLLDLVGQYNELIQKRGDIGKNNPTYERLNKRIEEVRNTLTEVLANVRRINDMERRSFEKEYNSVLADLKNLPEKELAMVNFERSYKINDNYYTFLLQKQSEAQIRKASNVPDNKILQQARINHYPTNGAQKNKTYIILFAIGLLLPAVYIILRELLNKTVRTEADIAKITDIPMLGIIRHTDGKKKVMSRENAKSIFSECFRLIRSRIDIITHRKSNILIMITSAEPGDGKTHFAANLAGIYSMISPKVLLVDMDLRNPNLSKQLGYANNPGLVDVLIGETNIDNAIAGNDESLGFDFLPAGTIPPNPAEMISSDEMHALTTSLQTSYDYIIVDTSPVGLVTDAYGLSPLVDVNLIIARAFKTNKNFFGNFISQIQKDNIANTYIVLNDVKIDSRKKYGRYSQYGKYSGGAYRHYYNNDQKYYTDDETETTDKRRLFGRKRK